MLCMDLVWGTGPLQVGVVQVGGPTDTVPGGVGDAITVRIFGAVLVLVLGARITKVIVQRSFPYGNRPVPLLLKKVLT